MNDGVALPTLQLLLTRRGYAPNVEANSLTLPPVQPGRSEFGIVHFLFHAACFLQCTFELSQPSALRPPLTRNLYRV